MATPLPPPSDLQRPDEHMQISRRFIEHAREEIAKGERLQASEKVWGIVNHATAAIGKERGWITEDYANKKGIANVLANERNDVSISEIFYMARLFHENFYQNRASEADVEMGIVSAERFVEKIEEARLEGPQPLTLKDKKDVEFFRQATGRIYAEGHTFPDGYVDERRLARYITRWDREVNSPTEY